MSERTERRAPRVGIIMGSKNDFEVMRSACKVLEELDIPFEARVVSAHRTPDAMYRYAESAESRGLMVIIAAAGGAAHLPGMVAAKTTVPVFGVPIPATALVGVDALLSMVQMPKGVPVGTLAIGPAGAENAALLAAGVIGTVDAGVRERLHRRRQAAERAVLDAVVLDDYPRRPS
jgi:5-(carboxyamino)imidazole ribonucleotide mutase